MLTPLVPLSNVNDSLIPDLDPAVYFNILRIQHRNAGSFPRTVKIAVWNCCGINRKYHQIHDLFSTSGADILVLNETFRSSNSPWPKNLPPCLGEATFNSSSLTDNYRRNINGVAVLANPRSIGTQGTIRKFEILEVDNINGTKVVLRINNFVLFSVYTPTSMGLSLLSNYFKEARHYATGNQSVIFCGDINALSSIRDVTNLSHIELLRHRALVAGCGSLFLRADTGPESTRPANRTTSIRPTGNTLDHIFGSNVELRDSSCLFDFVHTSDHHPIVSTIAPQYIQRDDSTRYWRIRTERLAEPDIRAEYYEAFSLVTEHIQDELSLLTSVGLNRFSPINLRKQMVDKMEHVFVSTVLGVASTVLGRKRVPILTPSVPKTLPSEEYLDVKRRLGNNYSLLRQHGHLSADDPVVASLLASNTILKARLSSLDRIDTLSAYKVWTADFCNLSAPQRMKILNRSMRRRSAAGSSLPTNPSALDSYRNHFSQQFVNPFPIPGYVPPTNELDDSGQVAFSILLFPDDKVLECILRSPAHKAPGLTGLSADLLHPIASLVAPLLTSLFCTYSFLDVIPSSWARALICPVPKKGDLSLISNYRPISLTEVCRKIYEMCILDRLKATVSLSREQGGFRTGRSTLDQIQALDSVINNIRASGKRPYLAFLDIKAAYDSVPRAELWRRCEILGVDVPLLSCLRALFDHNSAQLAISQRRSQPFGLSAGVLQGSVLSPILYSIYLDPLVLKLRAEGPLIPLPLFDGGINCFLYADDIALVASSAKALTRLLDISATDSINRGYRFSPVKCVVVSPGKQIHKLYGGALLRQNSFCYLGVEISHTGINCLTHVRKRIEKAEKAAYSLQLAGARYKNFPAKLNIQFYAVFIRPGLEYGLPLLLGHKGSITALNRCQKRIVCRFLGVDIIARNDIIQAISNCPPFGVRQILLQYRRAKRFLCTWDSVHYLDHALLYVLRCISGDVFVISPGLNLSLTYFELKTLLFTSRINHSITFSSENVFDRAFLRWLLNTPTSPGVFRTILLWILGRWNLFKPGRCHLCGTIFTYQTHIVTCTGLLESLTVDSLLPNIPISPSFSSRMIIEYQLQEIRKESLELIPSMLARLVDILRQNLNRVFGDTYNPDL